MKSSSASRRSAETAIIVDAACDMPKDLRQRHDISVLPINIQEAEEAFRDTREESATIAFHRRYRNNPQVNISTRPTSVDQVRNLIVNEIAPHYKNALIVCISSHRSQIYNHALQAASMTPTVLRGIKSDRPFMLEKIRVVDSQSLFTGQAVLAYAASSLLLHNPKFPLGQLAEAITNFSDSIYTYIAINDPYSLKSRTRTRGGKKLDIVEYGLARTFKTKPILVMHQGRSAQISQVRGFDGALKMLFGIGNKAVRHGITIRCIMVSYAGNLQKISDNKHFKRMVDRANANGINVFLSLMSVTGSVYVGPGAVSISFCK